MTDLSASLTDIWGQRNRIDWAWALILARRYAVAQIAKMMNGAVCSSDEIIFSAVGIRSGGDRIAMTTRMIGISAQAQSMRLR